VWYTQNQLSEAVFAGLPMKRVLDDVKRTDLRQAEKSGLPWVR